LNDEAEGFQERRRRHELGEFFQRRFHVGQPKRPVM
jgi:hypothetical protein